MIRHGDLADNGVAVEEDLLEVDLPRLLALIPVMVQVPVVGAAVPVPGAWAWVWAAVDSGPEQLLVV